MEAFVEHMASVCERERIPVSEEALARFRALPFAPSMLKRAAELVEHVGWRCTSTKYVNQASPLQFICACGESFACSVVVIKKGSAKCPGCGVRVTPLKPRRRPGPKPKRINGALPDARPARPSPGSRDRASSETRADSRVVGKASAAGGR